MGITAWYPVFVWAKQELQKFHDKLLRPLR